MTDAALGLQQVLTFAVAGQALAIDAGDVAEVVAAPRMTRVPQAPPSLHGLANLRGKVVPIVSVEALLGGGLGGGARVIVLNGENPIGLAVDQINAIRPVASQQFSPDTAAELIETEDGPARLLKLEPLLAMAFAGRRRRATETRALSSPAETAPQSADLGFLQFELAGQAYALPLEQVREVTRPSPETAALPHSDKVMIGLMPLRGELLALVSLRTLLGLPTDQMTTTSRVVVASLGEASIGLLVDSVRSILRAKERDVVVVPSVLNRGAGEARIDAIVQTPKGLVSVLATERIFVEETVATIIAEGAGRGVGETDQRSDDVVMERFVLFRLADETYGLPIASVVEVVRLPERITRVPRAPDYVSGVMNHRGVVVPLVDQRRRFAVSGETSPRQRRVIVTALEGLTAGFVVDAVESILELPADALRAAPELAADDFPIFDRIATVDVDGRMVLLVDPRQLLDQAERDIVRDVARNSTVGVS